MARWVTVSVLPSSSRIHSFWKAHREKVRYQRRASELGERYGEKHPKMISTLADLEAAKRSLKEEVVKSVEQTRKEYEIAKIQEAKLQQFIDQQQSKMRSLSGKAYELAKLEREVDANRELYVSFLGRFKEADVAADYDLTDVRIIDRAQTPRTPFKPNKTKMVMIGRHHGVYSSASGWPSLVTSWIGRSRAERMSRGCSDSRFSAPWPSYVSARARGRRQSDSSAWNRT